MTRPARLPWWVTFADRRGATVETDTSEHAVEVAIRLTGCQPTSAKRLPYPAEPRLNEDDGPAGFKPCPSFCYRPRECKGKTACPWNPACSS